MQPVRDPLQAVPALGPGTLRRTMHLDVGPPASWSSRGQQLEVSGAARDIRAAGAGGAGGLGAGGAAEGLEVLSTGAVRARFDPARVLVSLDTDPDTPWAEQMVGTRAGGGFRRHLDQVAPQDSGASLVRQLLEDLPAAALISGYASLRLARRLGSQPGELTPPGVLDRMTDMCSGWRGGGTAIKSIASGRGVPIQDTPVAPDLTGDDPLAWHSIPMLELDWMRRRRLVDVDLDDDNSGARIWAMFRDTVGEEDGTEMVLHEYGISGRLVRDGDGMVLTALEADPRVLPFIECPAAASHVDTLVGKRLSDLPRIVPEVIIGIASCTHLNDLLRSMGGIAEVIPAC
jgi:hypothetical protein